MTVTALVLLYAAGLLPGVYFVITWTRRVSHPMSSAAIDASGWVYVMVALLALGLAITLFAGPPAGTPRLINGLIFLAAIDLLLWNRARRWHRHLRSVHGASKLEVHLTDEDLR